MGQVSKKLLVIIGLFSVLAMGLPFLNKPFHIDDTFVLTVSKQIIKDPFRPFGGMISWVGDPKTIFRATTNPPLLSYYMALFIVSFGCSEVALHIGMMLFLIMLALAIVLLSQRFVGASPWPLLFLMFSPAVVVSSNVMRDVPAAALGSMAIALFVMGVDRDNRYLMLSGSVLAGLAILTKYSAVVLLPVMAVYLILYKRWKSLPWLAMPLLILGLWCLHNLSVHGQIHLVYLIQKPTFNLSWQSKFYDAVAVLGSSLFLIPALILDSTAKRKIVILSSALVVAVPILVGARFHYDGEAGIQHYIWLGMGAMFLGWLAALGSQDIANFAPRRSETKGRDTFFLSAWFAAPFLFSIIFAPFQAVRHIIPALVPLTLLFTRELYCQGRNRSRLLQGTLIVFLLIQTTIAFFVNAADYEYANTYRRFAKLYSANLPAPEHEIWFIGSWGWQYYGNSEGFTHLWPNGRQPKVGDVIIEPLYVYKDKFGREVINRAVLVDDKVYTASIPIRTMNPKVPAGFYSTWKNKLPYFFTSEKDLEIFRVYRVEKEWD